MKKLIIPLFLMMASLTLVAQEIFPHREAVRIATYLNFDLSLFKNSPIPSDADVKRAVGVRSGEYVGLIVPECKLSAESFDNIGNKIIPVGQVWFHKITFLKDGEPTGLDKMQICPFTYRDTETKVALCLLGVKKKDNGDLELLVYGKEKTPLIVLPLKKAETKQEFPIEADAEISGSYATVTLKIVGKYQANFQVTEQNY